MAPETHLLASWLIAAKTTRNPRDCRLVTLAGIIPDADGLGLLIDWVSPHFGRPTSFYSDYHHMLLHGLFGAALIAVGIALMARDRMRVVLAGLLVFHLHLLCDLAGSRGPSPHDVWPIHYLAPFSQNPMWIWKGQWRLDGWQNRYGSAALLLWALWVSTNRGHSVVGVFSRRADAVFVAILRKWRTGITRAIGNRTAASPE